MTVVSFSRDSLEKVEKTFKSCNEIVINNMKFINQELNEITNILNTPKSSKIIPEQIKNLNEMIDYVSRTDLCFEKIFSMVKNEYSDFNENVKISVGENSE